MLTLWGFCLRLDLAAKIEFLAARNWFGLALLPRCRFGLRYKSLPKTRIVQASSMVGGAKRSHATCVQGGREWLVVR